MARDRAERPDPADHTGPVGDPTLNPARSTRARLPGGVPDRTAEGARRGGRNPGENGFGVGWPPSCPMDLIPRGGRRPDGSGKFRTLPSG